MEQIDIEELELSKFDLFLEYLTAHLNENGKENILFQPISNSQLQIDAEWENKFKRGFKKEFGEIGWRKLWVAKNSSNQIVGHIDIRSRNELNTKHRVLLGMGVDSNHRKLKIGQKLLRFVITYCRNHNKICWIDLEVLTDNKPAMKLYLKNDFIILANTIDMFRIENRSYDYTAMTLSVG